MQDTVLTHEISCHPHPVKLPLSWKRPERAIAYMKHTYCQATNQHLQLEFFCGDGEGSG